MEILLVRHGITEGNKKRCFSGGRTDEPLCEEGIRQLKERHYRRTDYLYASPMQRCLETAALIFPGQKPECVEGFRECDFGILEGKSHEQLSGMPEYEKFLAGGGRDPFPGGEAIPAFHRRTREAFFEVVSRGICSGCDSIGCVVHGGTIMAIMSYLFPKKEYYDWKVDNGEGYLLEVDAKEWERGHYAGTYCGGDSRRIYD